MKILAVCGMGLGTSLILRMNAEKALKQLGIEGDVEVSDMGSARALAATADLVLTSEELAEQLGPVKPKVITISNFIDPKGGDILVTVARDGGWGVLSVQDQGVGIPTADLPHVFERYQRARNVSAKFAGTGLGLAGAKELIELHGGSISVTSAEGVGSSFVVRLPLKRPRRRQPLCEA